jgi:leucyl aminopeptidase
MFRSMWLWLAFVPAVAFAGNSAPFKVVSNIATDSSQPVVFKQGDFSVIRNISGSEFSRNNLYWVNIEGAKQDIAAQLPGETLHYQPGLFYIVRVQADDEVHALSALLHKIGQPCGALVRLTGSNLVDATQIADPQPIHAISSRRKDVAAMIATVNPERIRATVNELSSIHTRYHSSPTGKTVADTLAAMYREYVQGRDDIEIANFDHGTVTPQPSLVIRIRGTQKPDEIVVLGSHLDSVNWWGAGSQPAPGADDNASGTATNLEVFRVLMEEGFRPIRTLEIHAYAAEEIGLNGSQDIATKYKAANKKVISMVQHDMNLYSASGQAKVFLVSNNTNAALNQSLSQLIDSYLSIPWELKNLSGGNSDHYSWTRAGYAASFPFEDPAEYNEHIHTEGDTIENSGHFDQAAAFARLGLAYISHYAGN